KMVRETRHLWVGNLPDNIREERIREHFKRYVMLLKNLAAAAAPAGRPRYRETPSLAMALSSRGLESRAGTVDRCAADESAKAVPSPGSVSTPRDRASRSASAPLVFRSGLGSLVPCGPPLPRGGERHGRLRCRGDP
ncbi:conserved hypothetical protein, partial [Ixodes scapularis]